jgi:DNA replication protein DnaC
MKKIELPPNLLGKTIFHSSFCELHTYWKNGEVVVKPIQKMVIDNKVVCPRCETEKDTELLKDEVERKIDEIIKLEKYRILERDSLVTDETILKARLDNYIDRQEEERKNKLLTIEMIEHYNLGKTFNTIFQGDPGSGKSHLSYSILKALNEREGYNASCLYISIEAMMKKIKGTFNDKHSKYTEIYFSDLLSKVDYLVLDDLGTETGAMESDKAASDFVHRILNSAMDSRQSKSTIITTNLSGEKLRKTYDSRLISRLLKNPRFIVFKETKDKRMINTPF